MSDSSPDATPPANPSADSAHAAEPITNKSREWLRRFLRERPLTSFLDVLDSVEPRPPEDLHLSDPTKAREDRRNYAQRMSEAAAVLLATSLRPYFDEILPHADGTGQESRARTGKGVKKLDVNYSTPQLGLGLGVSIKTINFRDPKTGRYTKNPTRNDNELRAEAMDYHERQPYAVLVAVLFMPFDSCDDGRPEKPKQSRSSFAQVVNVLRHRSNRYAPTADAQRFEAIFIGLYEHRGAKRGEVSFFNVLEAPPQFGRPRSDRLLNYEQLVRDILGLYDERNVVKPAWFPAFAETPTLQDLVDGAVLPEPEEEEDEGG